MPLRIAFDIDGVLADLASAYQHIEARLFGPEAVEEKVPETPDAGKSARGRSAEPTALQQKHEGVWRAIQATENFWMTLRPLEDGVVRRIQEAAGKHRWDVYFITQRPDTAGESVQCQTQRWLSGHGFPLPSVIVVRGSRGKLAAALQLDYIVDDTPRNCVDIRADSKAKPLLIIRAPDPTTERNVKTLGIGVAHSATEALDILEQAQAAEDNPTLLKRLARTIGWK